MLSPPVSMTGRLKKELDAADCWIKLLQENLKNRAQISLQENSQLSTIFLELIQLIQS